MGSENYTLNYTFFDGKELILLLTALEYFPIDEKYKKQKTALLAKIFQNLSAWYAE